MTVILQKGENIHLNKTDGNPIQNIIVGLGWDPLPPPKKKGFLGLFSKEIKMPEVDCDASAILCQQGKLLSTRDLINYANLTHSSEAVMHSGDNEDGQGEGDDETITIHLDKMPGEYDKIVVIVTIYQAAARLQHFGMIQNAFIRIVDADDDNEICRFNLSENYKGFRGMIFGEICKVEDKWEFNAIGEGTHEDSEMNLIKRFQ